MAVAKSVEASCDRSSDRIERIKHKQAQLLVRLLEVAKKVDSIVLRGQAENVQESNLFSILEQLQKYMKSEAHLRERIDQLVLVQRMRADAAAVGLKPGGGRRLASLPNATDISLIVKQLSGYHKGLEQLMVILRRDVRDLDIVKSYLERAAATRSSSWMRAGAR